MKPQERIFRYTSTHRGKWMVTYDVDDEKCRYYWRGVRVPWLAWAVFS